MVETPWTESTTNPANSTNISWNWIRSPVKAGNLPEEKETNWLNHWKRGVMVTRRFLRKKPSSGSGPNLIKPHHVEQPINLYNVYTILLYKIYYLADSSTKCNRQHHTKKSNKTNLFTQHTHRIFQPFKRQRKHAVADQLLDDADALAVLPHT